MDRLTSPRAAHPQHIRRSQTMMMPASANAHLEQLLLAPPMKVDTEALKSELEKLKERGGFAVLLNKGKAKYEYAMKAQHTGKYKKLVEQIRELMKPPLLQIDAEALRTALETSQFMQDLVDPKQRTEDERLHGIVTG